MLLVAFALGACDDRFCARHSDCAAGQVCSSTSTCIAAPDDAGADASGDPHDAGTDAADAPAAIDAAADAPGDAS